MKRFSVFAVALLLVACLMAVDANAQCVNCANGGGAVVSSGFSYSAPVYSQPVYSSGYYSAPVYASSSSGCSSCSSSFMQRGPIRRVIASRASVPFMERGPVRRGLVRVFGCRRCQ